MAGGAGQGGQDGQGLEAVQVVRAGLGGDVDAVGHEQEVEPAGFGHQRLALVEGEIDAGVDLGVRMPPVAPARSDAVQDEAEFQVSVTRHGRPPVRERLSGGVRRRLDPRRTRIADIEMSAGKLPGAALRHHRERYGLSPRS